MKKIVILGNSIVGVRIIEELLSVGKEISPILVSFDKYYPYHADILDEIVSSRLPFNKVIYKDKKFFYENNIQLLFDEKISRINFNTARIITKSKNRIEYDILIITMPVSYRLPNIKGVNKTGVFTLKTLSEAVQIQGILPLSETVMIISNSLSGLRHAEAFCSKGKDVILLTGKPYLWEGIVDIEYASQLEQKLKEKGINIITDNEIIEILGDNNVKAVRLKTGKVIATDIIIFDNINPDLKVFKEAGLNVKQGICVNDRFQTNIKNVFACGLVYEMEDYLFYENNSFDGCLSELYKEQAKTITYAIINKDITFHAPFAMTHFKVDDISVTTIGKIPHGNSNVDVITDFNKETGAYKRLFVKDNIVLAAVLINADEDKLVIERQIKDKTDIGQFIKSGVIKGNEEQILLAK